MKEKWVKLDPKNKIWWLQDYRRKGEMIFSFDRIHKINFFSPDYDELTPEQKRTFKKERPDLAILKP